MRIFDGLGQKLTKPTTICVIGSSPGIVSGEHVLVELVVANEGRPK